LSGVAFCQLLLNEYCIVLSYTRYTQSAHIGQNNTEKIHIKQHHPWRQYCRCYCCLSFVLFTFYAHAHCL